MMYEHEAQHETKWYTVHSALDSPDSEENWCVVNKQFKTVEYVTKVLPAAMDVAAAYSDNLDRIYNQGAQGADVVEIVDGTTH